MKRLLCIVGGMNVGGAETFLMKVYRTLDRTQYQMDFVVSIEEDGAYDAEIERLGGRIYHITPKSKGMFKNFNDVRKIVKEHRYQYVLRTSQHSLSALELLAAWIGGAKIRVFRSSNSNTMSGSKKQLILHKLCCFMPKFFANIRIAPSTEAAEFMFGKGCVKKGRAQLIHNGIDLSVFRYDEYNRQKIRDEFNISDDTLVVGHIGRFTQQKNHQFLLEIFRSIQTVNLNSVALLVGKGELEASVQEKAVQLGLDGRVIFAGVRSDIPNLLAAMDVFVMPSYYEGMPNTVIEAQATGLPCVIADTITREANITGLVKYMSLKEDEYAWGNQILAIQRNSRPETTGEFYESKYDINSVVAEFIDVIFRTK